MNAVYVMKKGNPYPLGASRNNKTINFAVVANSKEECGVLLYEKGSITQGTIRIPFSEEHRVGNIYCGQIGLEQINQYEYNF